MTTEYTEKTAVWIGDLADYNAGVLRGQWFVIEEDMAIEHLQKLIGVMLAEGGTEDSPHEEWFIGDYDNVPLSGAYESLETILAVARLVQESGYAVVKAFLNCFGLEALDEFEDRFLGIYDSLEAYAVELVHQCYDLDRLLGTLAPYFDYEAFARDLELGGEVCSLPIATGQVVLFQAN